MFVVVLFVGPFVCWLVTIVVGLVFFWFYLFSLVLFVFFGFLGFLGFLVGGEGVGVIASVVAAFVSCCLRSTRSIRAVAASNGTSLCENVGNQNDHSSSV